MDINEFIENTEFLYHLTDKRNFEIVRTNGILISTCSIVNNTEWSNPAKTNFLRNRRADHESIEIDNRKYYIRDQRPISVGNLGKCLTDGLNVGDFLEILNSRVFFWPNIYRLQRHYNRYVNEQPIIIRVSTDSFLGINNNAEFSRWNTGATRSHPKYNGGPPPRGLDTFLPAGEFHFGPNIVAEVTFPESCQLPVNFHIGHTPQGPWEEVSIN